MRVESKSSMISICVLNANPIRKRGKTFRKDRDCLDERNVGSNDVDDRKKILGFGYIDTDGEIGLFTFHCL